MGIEIRPRPIVVPQGSAPQCWAAATTSWLQLHKSRPQLNKQQLLDEFRHETFASIERGLSLNPILNSFQQTVNRYKIDHELIHGLGPEPMETAVIFEVVDGLIEKVFAIPAKTPS